MCADRARIRRSINRPLRPRAETAAREALENVWADGLSPAAQLAELVTAGQLREETFHRWLWYKQGFSPALVRQFLRQAFDDAPPDGLILDPFAGAGTVPIECSRRDVPAVGVEAVEALAFTATVRGARQFPALPSLAGAAHWREIADRFTEPLHRAALICAAARQHTSTGKLSSTAPPLKVALRSVLIEITEDLQTPLPRPVVVHTGDARDLTQLEDESVAGVLTSPPYLSRHDYTRTTRPHEMIYRHWNQAEPQSAQRRRQVRAHARAYQQDWTEPLPPAVDETAAEFQGIDEPKLAGIVRSYFEDLARFLTSLHRVMAPGSPAWVIIGGARLHEVHIPSDIIFAELAHERGFEVTGLRVARRVVPRGVGFGSLADVAPRETCVELRKRR